jgi:hypothetical protein
VKNSVLKLSAVVGSGPTDAGDIQKITTGSVQLSPNSVGKPEIKLSYQHASQPPADQVDVSDVNNLVDSNGSAGSGQYQVVTPLYSSSQRVTNSGSPSSSGTSKQIYSYEPGQEFQQISTKGVGSSSYQLIEIGGGSSGSEVSGSSPVLLSLTSEPTNTENGKPSAYISGDNVEVTSQVTSKNSALQFGDRIPNVGSAFIQTVSNVQQDQNEIYKEKQDIIKVTSPPIPQRHSVLRPIIVAEIFPKEHEEATESVRPIVVSPITTPATVHVSHSPESTSSISLPGSGRVQPVSVVTNKHEATDEYSTPTNILSHSQDVSVSYSSGSESSSPTLGSVTNNGLSGHIVSQVYSTPKPVLLSHTKETTASASSSGSEGSSSESASFIDGGHTAKAEPLVYTTPVPAFVSYSHDISGAREVNSQPFASNVQQNPPPIGILYPPASSYSRISSAVRSGTNKGDVITGVFSTPAPVSLLQSQDSYTSTIPEENSQQQSITIGNNGNSGQVIVSQHSAPTTVYVSHSPKSSSFSLSKSVGGSQISSSVTTINNDKSGSNVFSETVRPTVASHSNSEGSFSRYTISPSSVVLNLNPHDVGTDLTSSVDALAPIKAEVSLGSIPHQQSTVVSGVSLTPEATPQPPQVKEDVDDIPQTKTVVEVQKAVSLDFNSLVLKHDGEKKQNVGIPKLAVPIAQGKQVIESGKQVEEINNKQQIYTGNLIEYVYGQPLTGLQAYPQVGYSLPYLIGSTEQLLYGYNPQTFDAQKLIHFRYSPKQQLRVGLQQQAPYEQSFEIGKQKQQQEYAQKQVDEQLQAVPGYQQQEIEYAKVEGKDQYGQQLKIQLEDISQIHNQQKNIEKQNEATSYNQQFADGGQRVFGQILPEVTQAVSGYSQQSAKSETEVKKNQAPEQIIQEIKYQQPLEIRQQVEHQLPIEINPQVTYQLLSQQTGYQVPIEFNQQIDFLAPTKLQQQLQQSIDTVEVQSSYNQQTHFSPGHTLQIIPASSQASEVSSISTKVNQPAYNRNPDQVSKQLQSEYNRQLLEEEIQKQVRFSNQIGKALKQLHADYNEGSVGTQVPVNLLKEEKTLPLPVTVDYPALTPPAAVQLNRAQALIKAEKPVPIEQTKLITVQKPVTVHHTKVVDKPIAVSPAVPIEVTKLVAVDRPVPYPQPIAVPHPVPVPYAVPHPIEVPVPHLVPYPHVITVPYEELHPVYIRNGKPHKNDFALYPHKVQNFPSNTPLPVILKALHYNGGRYGVPVSIKPHRFHSSHIPQPVYLTPPPLKLSGRGRNLQQTKNLDHLATLCVEYGFKPPLVPSVQIHDVPSLTYDSVKKE